MNNEELVLKYQQGDAGALDRIIEQNQKIVLKLANKFYVGKSNSIDLDDLVQEGYIGLMIATKKYNFDNPKKAKFITYAVYWIYKKMNMFIERKHTNDEISLQSQVDEGVQLQDTLQDPMNYAEYVEKSLYHEEVRTEIEDVMLSKLSLIERDVIKLNFGWDGQVVDIQEVSEIYNIKRAETLRTKNRALDKIRSTSWAKRERRKRKYERYV